MIIYEIKNTKMAILIGRGGRLKAIYNCARNIPDIDIAAVVSHKIESPGVGWAKDQGLDAFYFRLNDFVFRDEFNLSLAEKLKSLGVNFIVMAGWDLILSDGFLSQFPNQVINIHPSLLPAFPGMNAEQQALDAGVKFTGCTLHFVPDSTIDNGPIISQSIVSVEHRETLETLQNKIHKEEEIILCEGIRLFAQGRLRVEGKRVIIE